MRAFLEERPDAVSAMADRMRCIPRMLAARNRRSGRPLSEHDLADLAQDTASSILKKLPSFEGRAALETWFHRFCGFEFANAVRRSSRQPRTMSEIDDPPAPMPDDGSDAEPAVEGIEHLLRHLSAREADVVRLRHVDEVETLGEIAAILGVSVSSVKTHYYRALEKLRVVLESAARADQGGTR